MNEIKIFEKEEFGKIRTVKIDRKVYFVASDVAKALGYANVRDAILRHCRWVVKHDVPHPQSRSKTLEVTVIPHCRERRSSRAGYMMKLFHLYSITARI